MADAITVTSSLFDHGETIPTSAAFGDAGGENTSPDLSWSGVPEGTQSIAVALYDPDAPTTIGFVHWVLFDVDPSLPGIEAGAGAPGKNPPGSVLGWTDWGATGYGGMAPPPEDEPHHYQFQVFALDTKLSEFGADETTTYAKLRFMIRGHVLAEGVLVGRFGLGG